MAIKLMVMHPDMTNYNFAIPLQSHSVFDVNVAAAASSFDVSATTWSKYAKKGDWVMLGPSSATGYIGKTEIQQIESISTKTIDLLGSNTLTNGYSAGDNVVIISTKVADSWVFTGDVAMTAESMHVSPASGIVTDMGFDGSNYRQKLKKAGAGSTYSYFAYQHCEKLLTSTLYRVVLYYSLSGISGTAPSLYFSDGSGGTICSEVLVSGNNKHVNTGTSLSSVSSGLPTIYIRSSSTDTFTSLLMDLLVCGHAKFTSSENLGYLAFPYSPMIPPQISFDNKAIQSIGAINRGVALNYLIGHKGKKTIIRLTTECSYTFIQDLEILKFWNDKGNKIIFEHDFRAGDSLLKDSIPPILIGNFKYSMDKEHWNLNLATINFEFTEE